MLHIVLPALWLLVLIVGLPQLSETVYTPSLPDIARSLRASESMVEYTLTMYLFAFAVGTLFWGKLSDRVGRKPCVLVGFFIFLIGCLCCYYSTSINALMLSRFIQAFGGSVGSVVGQAICRDSFHGPALGKVFSTVSSALAFSPAFGPVIGGIIAERCGWSHIFLFLALCAVVLGVLVLWYLPETHHASKRQAIPLWTVASSLMTNTRVLAFGFLVAASNGINFSYFAEGSFYLIKLLGLSPSYYGLSFMFLAISSMAGGLLSKKLHDHCSSPTILGCGITVVLCSTSAFCGLIMLHAFALPLPGYVIIVATIAAQMATMFGVCMITSNALALALADYTWCRGTASSLFGCFYYSLISLCTLGMGALHNGTLLPMPLYFLGLGVAMMVVYGTVVRR